jgi:23S rRNA (uracil1939-C5)-methyltransferase
MSKTNLHGHLFDVEIIDITVEGKGIARLDDNVFFVENAVPGDKLRINVISKKRRYYEAKTVEILEPSTFRKIPFCKHFSLCGGCKWQHLSYEAQLEFKQKQVFDQLERIGKITVHKKFPIISSDVKTYYRNKLEFTFSTKKWFVNENDNFPLALGFHIPNRFDKVLDIDECFLQIEPSNQIRNAVRKLAIEKNYSFYDLKQHVGFLRNLIVRCNRKGEFMVILSVAENHEEWIQKISDMLTQQFPQIVSCYVAFNSKMNDSLENVELQLLKGDKFLTEELLGIQFLISPVSFFQTNPYQAEKLYTKVLEFAALTGNEIVFDLFCGTGTISLLVAQKAKFVLGVEYVDSAVKDAFNNSRLNNIQNIDFIAGDVKNVLVSPDIKKYGKPDLIILDPPRAGVHPDVMEAIIAISPEKIIYVSCNAATQARDLVLLTPYYSVEKAQPVDMFPFTSHVENIVELKKNINNSFTNN